MIEEFFIRNKKKKKSHNITKTMQVTKTTIHSQLHID